MLTSLITSDIILIIILSLGLTALAIEILVPSFGLIGVAGIYLIIESVLSLKNFTNPILPILISVIISISLTFIITKTLLKNIESNKLVLNKSMSNTKGNKINNNNLIDKEGIVVKILRPSGEVDIDGIKYSAISSGDYISKGEKVIVDRIEGSQIYCKKIRL